MPGHDFVDPLEFLGKPEIGDIAGVKDKGYVFLVVGAADEIGGFVIPSLRIAHENEADGIAEGQGPDLFQIFGSKIFLAVFENDLIRIELEKIIAGGKQECQTSDGPAFKCSQFVDDLSNKSAPSPGVTFKVNLENDCLIPLWRVYLGYSPAQFLHRTV